ncbi:MAG: choice-of-anchor L domain-containing protein [Suipraeoptans sp.]
MRKCKLAIMLAVMLSMSSVLPAMAEEPMEEQVVEDPIVIDENNIETEPVATDDAAEITADEVSTTEASTTEANTTEDVTASEVMSDEQITTMSTGTVVANVTEQQITDSFFEGELEVTSMVITGSSEQIGIFNNAAYAVGFDGGIVLSTGFADRIFTNIASGSTSGDGDDDLSALVGGSTTNDAISIEFNIIPKSNSITFSYTFASNEWDQPATYNDVFALFVNGVNYALIPGTTTPITISSVREAIGAPVSSSNPETSGIFINTEDLDNFAFEGTTIVFECVVAVNPNVNNTIKIAIADVGDRIYDSAIFLQGKSFYEFDDDSVDVDVIVYEDPIDDEVIEEVTTTTPEVKNTSTTVEKSTNKAGTVKTSDASHAGLYMAMFLLSGLLVIMKIRKRSLR